VNDGQEDSLENLSVVVSSTAAANSPPFANSGPDSSAFTGNAYILNGSSSVDPDGDTLTYYWEALSGPQGTAAILFDTEAAITFFTPDIIGDYIFRLTVSDGVEDASSDVNITAINPPSTITDSNVHLFSTDSTNNIIYLGCWTCNQFDSNSIHNSFSNYGNSFSSLSIRNAFSTYGNPFSPKSACNTLGNDAPNLFDGIGEYYGRISTNQFSTDSICNTGSSFYSSVDCATLNTYCDN
jgi:hypothetical protein